MSSKVPKFLLGGVNIKHNFLGLLTIQTAIYGWGEVAIKVAPIFLLAYGASKFILD